MRYIRKNSRLIILLSLFSYFFISHISIRDRHTHFDPNGLVVVHFHPIEKDADTPIDHHDHHKSIVWFFNNLQFHAYTVAEIPDIRIISNEVSETFYLVISLAVPSVRLEKPVLRGPPQA